MKLIALTQGQFAKVDDADYTWLSQWKWQARWDNRGKRWYAKRDKKCIAMHRELLGCVNGDNIKVDHINGDGLDNQRHNIVAGTHSQNLRNRTMHRQGRLVGTTYCNHRSERKWRAQSRVSGKNVNLSYFETEREANTAFLIYEETFLRQNAI